MLNLNVLLIMFTMCFLLCLARTQKIVLTVTAGDRVCLSLKAHDSFSNPHTTGGTIHKATLKGVGQKDVSLRSMRDERLLEDAKGADVICRVSDEGNGTYSFCGFVFTAGKHDVVVTTVNGISFTMGKIKVIHASLYAMHCSLELDGTYRMEPEVSKTYTLVMKMHDEFFNACDARRVNLSEIKASAGQYQLNCTPHDRDRTKLKLSFSPKSPGLVELVVSVRGELLPTCPISLNVKAVTKNFFMRFWALSQYLEKHLCQSYTPTLTIDRNNLLVTAMRLLNQGNCFRKIVRVRFDGEPGIDTGGLSR